MNDPPGARGPGAGGTGGDPAAMEGEDPALVLTVVLDRSKWLRGAVTAGAGPPDRFEGWVGFMAVVDRLRLQAVTEE